jgi:hypothetical protein
MALTTDEVNILAGLVAERVVRLLRQDMRSASPWMTPEDAATYLHLTKRGLEDMRAQSAGPRYHRVGLRLVRYHRADLDCWLLTDGQLAGRPDSTT